MALEQRLADVPKRMAELAARFGVPGASLAVAQDDDVFDAVCGVLHAGTAAEVTADSAFQIGSITKTFTATQVMQLVDEGRVELDRPIWSYLPEAHFGDPEATTQITVRQLLTHTSGLDGDFFEETGRGEDCVERYVLACRALPQIHAPGALFSYCNAGFVLLGRLVEKLRAKPWDQALRDDLLSPLGTERMGTLPEQALLRRVAVGHMPHPKTGKLVPTPFWRLPASNGPAGSTPFASARDLLRFARAHTAAGRTADGGRILSERAALAMRERQVALPAYSDVAAWGLGFMLFDWGAEPVFGHDGSTVGQMSFLRILPGRRIAVALLTNGGDAGPFSTELFAGILGELADVRIPARPKGDARARPNVALFAGRYERLSLRVDVELRDGALVASAVGRRGVFRALPPQATRLVPAGLPVFAVETRGSFLNDAVEFVPAPGSDAIAFLHAGLRATPRR